MKTICKIVTVLLLSLLSVSTLEQTSFAAPLNATLYPGVKVSDGVKPPYAVTRPYSTQALNDAPQPYKDNCHAGKSVDRFKLCVYGTKIGYRYTIALVGDSHTAHWYPAIENMAYKNKIRILYTTKTACAYSAAIDPEYASCNDHNADTQKMLLKYKPLVVVTKGDQTPHGGVPEGFLNRYNELGKKGIKVFAIRNTARWPVNVPSCVKQYGKNSKQCIVKREQFLPVVSNWDKLPVALRPANVKYIDFANKMCSSNYCYPVQGNILKIRDSHHMTDSYARTFSSYFEKELLPYIIAAHKERQLTLN